MFTQNREILSFRALSIIPIVLFLPSLISFAVAPGSIAAEYTGVLFHLSIFFVVARMDGPIWAKAAGFGWLALDIACGAMMINAVPYDIAFPVRLGGHVLAGLFIVTSSLLATSISIRVVGVVTGLWLGLYTFVAPELPHTALAPAGILTVVWFALLAWKYTPTHAADARPAQFAATGI